MPTVRYEVQHGLELVADVWGEATDSPLLFLHGGGQTRHSWGGVAERIAMRGWYSICVDQRGHGDSDWSADGAYEIADYVDDLHRICNTFRRPAIVVGASLGGIAGLLGEAERGPLLRALVLVDIAVTVDHTGTNRIDQFMRAHLDGFESIKAAADAIAEYLPNRRRPKSIDGVEKNLRRRNGRWYWHWDPNILNDRFRSDANNSDRLRFAAQRIEIPTLLVRGKLSDVLTEDAAKEFQELVPQAEFVHVIGAA